MFLTSVVTGSKIRTMWMTPFYLFFGTFVIYLFKAQINIKKLKPFVFGFTLFIFSITHPLFLHLNFKRG